jgi:hypothetical protein
LMDVKKMTIVDPKTITESNIGTHIFFKHVDIGKSKVSAIKNSIDNDIICYEDVMTNTPSCNKKFNGNFYGQMSCVIGSMDNYLSREYVSGRCALFKTPYIDCGTEKFMGHVQIVIPHLTDILTSTNDNVIEPSYPLCAIASFPTKIEHCIMWAKEQYDMIFNNDVVMFCEYLKNPVIKDDNHKEILLKIFNSIPNSHNACYLIASNMFKKLYCDTIDDLLDKFPEDYVLDDGTLFWTLPKKCPHKINCDKSNKDIAGSFINKFVKLWSRTFDIGEHYFEYVEDLPTNLEPYKQIIINIQNRDSRMIHYMAMLRGLNYNIESIDEFDSIGIIENIVPRLVGVSTMVAGLATLEYCKIVANNSNHKNHFVDTLNNEFIRAEPMKYKKNGQYGIWDSFVFSQNDVVTVGDMISVFKKDYDINITAILYGSFMFYSEIFDEEKLNKRLDMKIVDIIEGENGKIDGDSIILQVYDDGDDDVEFPDVIFNL